MPFAPAKCATAQSRSEAEHAAEKNTRHHDAGGRGDATMHRPGGGVDVVWEVTNHYRRWFAPREPDDLREDVSCGLFPVHGNLSVTQRLRGGEFGGAARRYWTGQDVFSPACAAT